METDWSKLAQDALCLVFVKLGAVEVLTGAGLVCRSWLQAAKLPDPLWQSLDMDHLHSKLPLKNKPNLRAMAKEAVDRASGRLEAFTAEWFVDDELLGYIASRSPSLRSLKLVDCSITNGVLMDLLDCCPYLEVLYVSDCCNIIIDGALLDKCGRISALTLIRFYYECRRLAW
ncbi:unnamed protein product [Triticum turgidum subsp. durum]|uniref:F-box domain-containing protein n=1 Tax=Triticum turgidum subsp. durum TaxID=4567 RepID=A0A9R0X1P1_TRITD|nr:unnamed protein product [Triticum turgidum subsp. durum]